MIESWHNYLQYRIYHDIMISDCRGNMEMNDNKNNKQILIRVSQDLHREMKILSAKTGKSINDYVVSYLEHLVKVEADKK